MAKGLLGVIRYRKHVVDEKRRKLGDLLRQEDYLLRALGDLEAQMRQEAEAAASDIQGAGRTYALYIQRAHERRDTILAALAETRRHVARAQDEVRDSFKDLKTLEIAQENRETTARREAEHKEQIVLDDIGLDLYRRRDRGPG
jgi:flagellar export protein FliJ